MTRSSLLGGERAAEQAPGRDVDALGPSDSSDSGSDVQGELALGTPDEVDLLGGAMTVSPDSDTDAEGTGERAGAVDDGTELDADIRPDRIVGPDEIGALDEPDERGEAGALDGLDRDAESLDSAAVDTLAADPPYGDEEDEGDDEDEPGADDHGATAGANPVVWQR